MNKLMKAEQILAKAGDVSISLANEDSMELVSYYLRDVRGRIDLTETVRQRSKSNSFSAKLETIRTYIVNEKFALAKSAIDLCVSETKEERSELSLERARYYFYTGEFGTSKEILQSLIGDKDVPVTTKITSHELLGQCFFRLGHIEHAVSNLKKAMDYLDFFPFVISAYVAGAHLVKIKSEQKKFSEANEILAFLRQKLRGLKQDEVWLSRSLLVARGYYHYLKNSGERKLQVELLHETLAIAVWLGDLEMIQRCRNDLKELSEVELKSKNINFLPSIGVLLISNPKSVSHFESSPILTKALNSLLSGEKTLEELFENVYGYAYNKERHEIHLRSLLSKLRKKLPPNSLLVKNGVIVLG